MKKLFDLTSVRSTLQHGIDRGYWTLEDLDRPPPRHLNPTAYRNLLRDAPPTESIAISDPRDFTPAPTATGTPADSFRRASPSLLLDAHRALDETQHHQGDQHQIPKGNGADQQNQRWPAGVGVTRHHHSSVHGTVPDDW